MRQLRNVTAGLFLLIFMVLSLTACTKSLEEQIAEQLELGQKYLAELNYEEAIVAFTKAIELEEKTEVAYIRLAEAYEGSGDVWQAARTLETGYELFPEEDMKNLLAETYKRALEFFAEDTERQIEIYDRLIELSPDEEYYQKLAEIYEAQENIEQEIKILEDGILATDSEKLKEKLKDLKGVEYFETVTVEGLILDNWYEYEEFIAGYVELYANPENKVSFGVNSHGVRFSKPIVVSADGERTLVSEAEICGFARPFEMGIQRMDMDNLIGQVVQLTGHFEKREEEGEIIGPEYYEEDGWTYYSYCPNGPYEFWLDELPTAP